MDDSKEPVVIGVGELLWDCFADSRRPGGAPANVAFHAGQLGLEGVLCSRVGQDALGRELVSYLGERGVNTAGIQHDQQHPTGTVTVKLARAEHPTYVIPENVAWDHLEFTEDWAGSCARAAAVCFGTLAQRSPASRDAVMHTLAAATPALRVYDVNLRPPWFSPAIVSASCERADVIKLNIAEVTTVIGLLGIRAASVEGFARALFDEFGVKLVCVTRGPDGCLLMSPEEAADVPGRLVATVDAVGAGDAFTAALTLGLLSNWPLPHTARFANEVGALVTSQPGAMPMLRGEFAALRASFSGELANPSP